MNYSTIFARKVPNNFKFNPNSCQLFNKSNLKIYIKCVKNNTKS